MRMWVETPISDARGTVPEIISAVRRKPPVHPPETRAASLLPRGKRIYLGGSRAEPARSPERSEKSLGVGKQGMGLSFVFRDVGSHRVGITADYSIAGRYQWQAQRRACAVSDSWLEIAVQAAAVANKLRSPMKQRFPEDLDFCCCARHHA